MHLAKGDFFDARSECVLYADATYTRVYTVPGGWSRENEEFRCGVCMVKGMMKIKMEN